MNPQSKNRSKSALKIAIKINNKIHNNHLQIFSRLLKDDVMLLNETQLFADELDQNQDDEANNTLLSGKRSSRDALNAMETDLSASIMVLPLENSEDGNSEGLVDGETGKGKQEFL